MDTVGRASVVLVGIPLLCLLLGRDARGESARKARVRSPAPSVQKDAIGYVVLDRYRVGSLLKRDREIVKLTSGKLGLKTEKGIVGRWDDLRRKGTLLL